MPLSGTVCLVTGACGFLGERITKLLMDEGVSEIRLLDRNIRTELVEQLEASGGQTKVCVFEGDIQDSHLLGKACQGVSTVIHTASIIDVRGAVNYRDMHQVNVKGTQLLLEACFQENVASFVYTSSIEVAGPNARGDPVCDGDEDTPYACQLTFAYSKTKREAERLSLSANGGALRNGGRLASCALRPAYIYGEGCRFLQGHMLNGVRNNNVLLRSSRPEAKVNPVYVGNVALAHVQAARALRDPQKRAVVGGKFYFITDDTPHASYSDFNHSLLRELGFGLQDKPSVPLPLLYIYAFLMEMLQVILRPVLTLVPPVNRQLLTMLNTHFTFTYRKAHRELGYTPRYTWDESRRRTQGWLASVLQQGRDTTHTQ